MKQRTRTVYEQVTETREKTEYDTHYESNTIHEVRRVAETHFRQEEFSYQVPYLEPRTYEVPYMLHRPVYETRSRDINYITYVSVPETRTRQVPYTVYNTIQESRTRTVPYSVAVKVPYTITIDVPTGHWETKIEEHPGPVLQKCIQEPGCWTWDPCRCCCIYVPGKSRIVEVQCPPVKTCKRVWVPRVEQCVKHCTKTVYETRTRQEPYTICRSVPETRTREVQYTITRQMPVTNTRTISYQVQRLVPEQHTRTVTQMTRRLVAETGTRTVPYTVWKEIPVTRTEVVPRTVPRTVTYTVTRCVPRTETYEVPVRVCVPVQKGSPIQKNPEPASESTEADEPVATRNSGDAEHAVSFVDREQPAVSVSPTPGMDAGVAFSRGMNQYNRGNFAAAIPAFEEAATLDQDKAIYAYYWALALRQGGLNEQADEVAAVAISREKSAPIAAWGRSMERVQGSHRVWLEQLRREALAHRNPTEE